MKSGSLSLFLGPRGRSGLRTDPAGPDPDSLRRGPPRPRREPHVPGGRGPGVAPRTSEAVDPGRSSPRSTSKGTPPATTRRCCFGSGRDSRTILPANDWSYRLTLSQPVYAGNRERKASSRPGSVSRSPARECSTPRTRLDRHRGPTTSPCWRPELLAVEQQNLELARRRRDQAQIFFEAGETTRVDVLRAERRHQGGRARIAAARQAREAAVGRLRLDPRSGRHRGSDPGGGARGRLPAAAPAGAALVAEAERRRPEVAQAGNAQEIARLEVGKQRGPTCRWSRRRRLDQPAVGVPVGSVRPALAALNVPFSRRRDQGRVAIAQERQRQAELRVQEVRQAIREEVRQALVELETAAPACSSPGSSSPRPRPSTSRRPSCTAPRS